MSKEVNVSYKISARPLKVQGESCGVHWFPFTSSVDFIAQAQDVLTTKKYKEQNKKEGMYNRNKI